MHLWLDASCVQRDSHIVSKHMHIHGRADRSETFGWLFHRGAHLHPNGTCYLEPTMKINISASTVLKPLQTQYWPSKFRSFVRSTLILLIPDSYRPEWRFIAHKSISVLQHLPSSLINGSQVRQTVHRKFHAIFEWIRYLRKTWHGLLIIYAV